MEFLSPIADSLQYPKPKILGVPQKIPEGADQVRTSQAHVGGFLLDCGRSALYIIAKVLKDKRVWVPAYHCPALVQPFLAVGAEVKCYPLLSNLHADIDAFKAELKKEDVFVAVRYFGIDGDIHELVDLCNEKQLVLVEDLAHAAFVKNIQGQFAIKSLTKFYPNLLCGELLFGENCQFKRETLSVYEALPGWWGVKLKQLIGSFRARIGIPKIRPHRYLDLSTLTNYLPPKTLEIVRNCDVAEMSIRRRLNYLHLLHHLNGSPYGTPLYSTLSDSEVPYVFPFLAKDDSVFGKLRYAGIQVFRWEEIAVSGCAISLQYRKTLLQLPCHQDITQADLDFMIEQLT
ncbi:hypothetical protein GCM10009092_37330 [Bowmanella denitrificans]|uniref:Aminotransferase class I/classII large domain-containing protein n=1 Tax=Bowmanella denitrificans TaxID=366582 RepID=A0ABN0XPK2_9ALTE